MNKVNFSLVFILFLLNFSLSVGAQTIKDTDKLKSGIVTLTSQSSHQSFCFRDGQFVEYVSKLKVTNDCPDIIFNLFSQHSFSTAFTSNYSGRIENVGNFEEMRQKYNYQEDIDNQTLFDSIQLINEKFILLKNVHLNKAQKLKEADRIFQGAEFDTVKIINGGFYIVRFSDDINLSFQRIVKFFVTDFKPNESVTIKWEVLFDNQNLNKKN